MAKPTTDTQSNYSPDQVIGDYLGELLGEVSADIEKASDITNVGDNAVKAEPGLDLFRRKIIADGHHLIPTIRIGDHRRGAGTDHSGTKQSANGATLSLIILLNLLYFLRRPLSPLLRSLFIEKAGEMVTELQFLQSFSGELSEP